VSAVVGSARLGLSAGFSAVVHFQFSPSIFSSRLMQYNGFHFQFSFTVSDLFNNLNADSRL
tara:strand:- start:8890 stop:9072 length:183 start_codon:yes stop_codon:yes gene_type:complete